MKNSSELVHTDSGSQNSCKRRRSNSVNKSLQGIGGSKLADSSEVIVIEGLQCRMSLAAEATQGLCIPSPDPHCKTGTKDGL